MDQYRVFGNPIAQSKSPTIQQQFAQQTQQTINYQKELVEIGQFKQAVNKLMKHDGKGANVTAPFKEEAFALCTHLTKRAKLAGAVNTLTFINGEIHGDTTDGIGLVNDLLNHDIAIKGRRILLLGAGGAAKGVVQSILEQQPDKLVIANRTVSKASEICAHYPADTISASSFDEANTGAFDVIINATSAGLTGNSLPITDPLIEQAYACYDMVYGKELTPFLKKAKQLGVEHVVDGLGMLVGQAAASFAIWRNVLPEVEHVLINLRESMELKS